MLFISVKYFNMDIVIYYYDLKIIYTMLQKSIKINKKIYMGELLFIYKHKNAILILDHIIKNYKIDYENSDFYDLFDDLFSRRYYQNKVTMNIDFFEYIVNNYDIDLYEDTRIFSDFGWS